MGLTNEQERMTVKYCDEYLRSALEAARSISGVQEAIAYHANEVSRLTMEMWQDPVASELAVNLVYAYAQPFLDLLPYEEGTPWYQEEGFSLTEYKKKATVLPVVYGAFAGVAAFFVSLVAMELMN